MKPPMWMEDCWQLLSQWPDKQRFSRSDNKSEPQNGKPQNGKSRTANRRFRRFRRWFITEAEFFVSNYAVMQSA
jgi:hypothetical protein